MHYCRSSMAPRGNNFDYTTNRHEITVYYFKPVCRIVKLLPLGAGEDLMHYCTRQNLCNSASGRARLLRVITLTILQTGMK